MNFLITNDDCIDAVFLHVLVTTLKDAGHSLYIAAPKTEQSWIGAAKSRAKPVEARLEDRGLGCPTWVIDGTPSDCVNIAMDHLLPGDARIDAVVSGINVGMNATLGFIMASGTVSGALEGALHGVPSFALSQDLSTELFEKVTHSKTHVDAEIMETLKVSATHAARLIPQLTAATPTRSFIVHNLNFPMPCTETTPVVRTVPAHVIVPRLFSPANDDGEHRLTFRYGDDLSPAGLQSDRAALLEGKISHSVLDYRRLGVPASQ